MSTTQSQNENPNYFTAMAGEFYVLAQLFSREYMGCLTYGNAKSVDILVSTKSGKMFKLEVKTTRSEGTVGSDKRPTQFGENYEWTMSEKHKNIIDENLYYCFVILRGFDKLPRFFIVSNQQVAQYMKDEYQHWLKVRKKEFKSHNRAFRLKLNSKKLHKFDLLVKNHENKWKNLPE